VLAEHAGQLSIDWTGVAPSPWPPGQVLVRATHVSPQEVHAPSATHAPQPRREPHGTNAGHPTENERIVPETVVALAPAYPTAVNALAPSEAWNATSPPPAGTGLGTRARSTVNVTVTSWTA
jgi:hypothetical protein